MTKEHELAALIKAYAKAKKTSANRLHKKYGTKIERLRKKLDNCTHSMTTSFEWEHDDGYGKLTKHIGLRCMVCLRTNNWPMLSSTWW